jgi:hypothetical protein
MNNFVAHCVKGFMWFMIKVTFGEHDRCDDSIRPETRFVLRAISQSFSYKNFDSDMALLRLNDRVPITDHIRPICLPKNKGKKETLKVKLIIFYQLMTFICSRVVCWKNWNRWVKLLLKVHLKHKWIKLYASDGMGDD